MTELVKPPYGQPCNGCGLCCQMKLCPLAEIAFPTATAPCPALERDGDRYACGLVANPQIYAPIKTAVYGVEAMRAAASAGIVVGVGCDARVDDEEAEPPAEYLVAIRRLERRRPSEQRRIEKLWSGRR